MLLPGHHDFPQHPVFFIYPYFHLYAHIYFYIHMFPLYKWPPCFVLCLFPYIFHIYTGFFLYNRVFIYIDPHGHLGFPWFLNGLLKKQESLGKALASRETTGFLLLRDPALSGCSSRLNLGLQARFSSPGDLGRTCVTSLHVFLSGNMYTSPYVLL